MSYVEVGYQMSERHACRLLGLGRTTHRYRARKAERDGALRTRLKELAAQRMRFGYRRLTAMLLREGMPANHKRVYRLYREEGLAMRIRQRRRIRWSGAVVKPAASQPNERWSMDFVGDCVSRGKVIRMLTIVDDCTRECPVIEVDTSLGGLRVRRVLDRIAIKRGLPEAIVEGLQRTTPTQFVELLAARRVCTDCNGDPTLSFSSRSGRFASKHLFADEFGESAHFEWFHDDFIRFQKDGGHSALHVGVAADQQRQCMRLGVAQRVDHRKTVTGVRHVEVSD